MSVSVLQSEESEIEGLHLPCPSLVVAASSRFSVTGQGVGWPASHAFKRTPYVLKRGAPDTMKAFGSLSTAATAAKAIGTKTKELMALAIGIAAEMISGKDGSKQLRQVRLFDPSSLDAGIYDDCLAILTRHPKAFEDTCMADGLSVFRFAPAIKIIGRTIGKIFNRLYTVLTEGDEHSRCYAWNILESGFNAKLLSLSIKIRLNAP